MAGTGRQKNKILLLKEFFETQTNEDNAVTVAEIVDYMAGYGISCERKTVYDDINTLIESGMDIVTRRRGHANDYYLASRLFQTEELYILADAVSSCKFLTKRKSKELIQKLQTLTNKFDAPSLSREIHVSSRVKAFNEKIYYTVNAIHEAIRSNKKITFKLAYYDIEKRKKLRHEGYVYTVSPLYLTWEEDNYYLVCYCEKHEGISRYRVDRLENVEITDENRVQLSIDEEALAKAQLSLYSMYGGTEETVTIEFDKELMNAVIDRFGQKVVCKKVSEDRFAIKTDVQISPPFWGWLFKFGDKAKVVEPAEVADQAKKELKAILKQYK